MTRKVSVFVRLCVGAAVVFAPACSNSNTGATLECGPGTVKDGNRCIGVIPDVDAATTGGAASSPVLTCGADTTQVGSVCISATGGISGAGGNATTGGNPSTGGSLSGSDRGGSASGGAASGLGGSSPAGSVNTATGGAATIGGTPSTGGAASTGGVVSTGGAQTTASSTASTGGGQSTGGAADTGGAVSTGGAESTTSTASTSGGQSTGGLASTGGVPSSGGSVATGGTSTAVTVTRGKWLAAYYPTPTALYDLSLFPSGTGVPLIGPTTNISISSWSPNGSKLLLGSSTYSILEVSDSGPGTSRILGAYGIPARPSPWSADSRSLAVRNGTSFGVISTTLDLPVLNELSRSVAGMAWAPTGSRLFYTDSTGAYVVEVVDGAPKTPTRIAASQATSWSWAADGSRIAVCLSGQLFWASFGATTNIKQLTAPVTSNPTCSQVAFNATSRGLVFVGSQARVTQDVHFVSIDDTGPGPIQVITLPAVDLSASASWAQTGDFLAITTGTYTYAIDLSGSAIGSVLAVPATVSISSLKWAPRTAQFVFAPTNNSLAMFDCTNPSAGLVPIATETDPISQFVFSPTASVLAFTTVNRLGVVDIQAPATLTTITPANSFSSDMATIDSWSPDGTLLAFTTHCNPNNCSPVHYPLYFLRVSGGSTSAPVSPWPAQTFSPTLAWQP